MRRGLRDTIRRAPDGKRDSDWDISDVLEKNLKVADGSAIAVARDNELPIHVLGMADLEKVGDTSIGTFISPE